MEKENPYYTLISQILHDFRITARGLQDLTGIAGLSTIITRLRSNPYKRLHPETIGKIEKTLNITINDKDLNNIDYEHVEEETTSEIGIPAPKLIGVEDINIGLKSMNNLHYIEINEKINTEYFNKGDMVVFNPKMDLKDNDKVIIKMKTEEILIKQISIEQNSILYIEDGKIKKILKQEIECMYKIVGSMQLQS